MTKITSFSEAVCNDLGHYVYRLVDPRDGKTFYIGKGKNNRVFGHVKSAQPITTESDNNSAKISQIKAIESEGLEVRHIIHRHNIPTNAVLEVEAALIDAYPDLSNVQAGHGSNDRGSMDVVEIMDKYALPKIDFEPEEKLVLININRLENRYDREAIYEQTRLAWRISKERADAAEFVLAVVRSVIVGAFVADEWISATSINFPNRISETAEMPKRKGFHGKAAPDPIWDKFVGERGRRISIEGMKHNQNPIRYWNA